VATVTPTKTRRSSHIRRLLGKAGGAPGEELVGPIRGEVFGAERLAEHARAIARQHRLLPTKRTYGSGPLLARLDETREVIEDVHRALAEGAERGTDISPAGEWLLDNHYVIREHLREVRTNLPSGYYQELPKLASGALAGYPRVYELAIELIAHTEGHLDLENITLFVSEYQRVAPLRLGELWAIPTMLRLGLIENLRRMALRMRARLREVDLADEWAARLRKASEASPAALAEELPRFVDEHPTLTPTFVTRFLQQIRAYQTNFTPLVWLEQWIAEDGPSAEEAVTRSNRRVALTQITVVNSIMSLRAVARLDWKEFVESQSATEKILRADPSGNYARMTFVTRDWYRHIVENVAKRAHKEEVEVARIAIRLARAAAQRTDIPPEIQARESHVGYYLVDDGRTKLDAETGYPPTVQEQLHRWILAHPNLVYFGGMLLLTIAAISVVIRLIGPMSVGETIAVALVLLLPLNEVSVAVMNQLTTLVVPPRLLPKLEFHEDGIPADLRTLIAIPTLFGSVAAVREMLDHVEVLYLANRDPHLHLAILSDFGDAPSEHTATDEEIVRIAREGIEALNARYPREVGSSFYLFHRERKWNAKQNAWMGWERKRGKLAQLNAFLRGGAKDAFSVIVGNVTVLESVRYVLTLDSDTVLPREAGQTLVGAMAHPLNRPIYDPHLGRVVRGYGIIQPRVNVSLTSAHRSLFAAIHSGHPGVDPYTTAVSDVYQDLWGEGSFTGKGIYDVDAFEQATEGRFPENTLLSHDLIEGTYVRAGLATDVELFDDYPTRYLTYTRRKHRWIRGDWQLLRWLRKRVPGPEGPTRNRLSGISRWKLLDNLRRSLVEIVQMAMLIAGWLWLPGDSASWTIIFLIAVAFPWVLSVFLAAVRPPLDRSWGAYYAAVGRDALTSAQQFIIAIVFLPHQALVSADAIVRTLVRLGITKRSLLEWQTASQVERTLGGYSAREVWRLMWQVLVLTAFITVGLVYGEQLPSSLVDRILILVGTIPLLVVWATSPAMASALSAPAIPGEVRLRDEERRQALRVARLHWEYFNTFVTDKTHWLAPDNFQENPTPAVAMRTSPTNIGFQLMSTVSAYDLGFIDLETATERLERVFRSMERMRRYRGHFFNWYDLGTLQPLEPAYISTVDSGNLAGAFIAVRQALLGFVGVNSKKTMEPETARRLRAMADRAYDYMIEMDFRFLFDETRKLFSIGYQRSTNTLDNSFYDLLASEARLASFLAIAKDDVAVEHWFRLGRTLTPVVGTRVLLSWSGSMFEYLMPLLVMRSFPFTLLDQTYHGAVKRQISYGAERDVPWGISESAYNVRDREQVYQYRGFGVPDLALKRGLYRELVVAPYATVLALLVDPGAALENMSILEAQGALGPYGFRDAIDYSRPDPDSEKSIVGAYMAHHTGMSLVALTNALNRQTWQERFHADPLVRSAELLLHERVPRRLLVQAPQGDLAIERVPMETERPAAREIAAAGTPQPRIALLGNAPLATLISNAGGGYVRYNNLAVTRWRVDTTRDNHGMWCYVRDVTNGRVWSTTYQPVLAEPDDYRAVFASDRATFNRRDGDVETQTEIAVVPEDAADVRRVTITNNGLIARDIELTSYAEIVLNSLDADRAHPAFGNLFVQTEFVPQHNALLAVRRPRSATETPLWCAHIVTAGSEQVGQVMYETDRARFIGRGRSVRHPEALDADGTLSKTVGAVLDPIFALRVRIRVEPGRSAQVTFSTIVAESRERSIQMADLYDDAYGARRAFDIAWAQAQAELRDLTISPSDAALYQQLAAYLLYPHRRFKSKPADSPGARRGQQSLWTMGLSGDHPILLATIDSPIGLPSVRQLLRAHRYWRLKGITCDLVILNTHPPSYIQDLNDQILSAVMSSSESGLLDKPGGVFIRRADLLSRDDVDLLHAVASVHMESDGLGVGNLLELPDVEDEYAPPLIPDPERGPSRETAPKWRTATMSTPTKSAPVTEMRWFNGFGGLNEHMEYEIRLSKSALPPAPWSNVIANPSAGFIITESGCGATWVKSSYFYRLTPWHNDPVRDPCGDCIYIRDDATGEYWTATPAPIRETTPYTVKHGAGYTTFDHEHAGIETTLRVGVAQHDPVKISVMRIRNAGDTRRSLSIVGYVEWVLGVMRDKAQPHVRTSFDRGSQAVLARNHYDEQFSDHIAFFATGENVVSYTADRREFIGRNGTPARPTALRRKVLGESVGANLDPCGALHSSITLDPGESHEIAFLLGAATSEESLRDYIERYRTPETANAELDRAVESWRQRLSTISVETPEPSFDIAVNQLMLYQALSCRMWARSAVYQSSGAYGFRDQLQDVMAFCYAEPGLAREHILRATARQFIEGDVQHWWHPHSGAGVRTKFSDDLAWLPYVVDRYITLTGDESVLDEEVPFLEMRTLGPNEHELYDAPVESNERATVYEHCLRALDRASTTGEHGLPLIGSGDWNDGLSRVGIEGRGESVWLAWFLIETLTKFAARAEQRGVVDVARRLRECAEQYRSAVERAGWDGEWYRRAYYDDGSPLGSSESEECKIDSIAQSWSVISGAGVPDRRVVAMKSLEHHLVRNDERLLLLLTPAFDKSPKDPGYIRGYLPGVRENGAQYTHAALWVVLATALQGDGARAMQLYQMINPLERSKTPADVETYKVDPFSVAADIYSAEGHVGRGGWTWYTGSASWAYRVALEAILGFSKRGNTLVIEPCIPPSWQEFRISYRFGRTQYEIMVSNPEAVSRGVSEVAVDGESTTGPISLVDDGRTHTVSVRLGNRTADR
jgi:cyclic beta-1,2-glucan synthetase